MSVQIDASNIALLGSDVELEARKNAAASEDEFQGAGDQTGIEKWRIVNFGVRREVDTPLDTFYDGDCYIVLYTYTKGNSEKKHYNVHFWIGNDCTQDESTVAGTYSCLDAVYCFNMSVCAAYKTVELDDLLGCAPVQYREVQGHESVEFLKLFGGKLQLLSGGVDSAFNVVKPEEYVPRLLHVKGSSKTVRVTQVEKAVSAMNVGDVFVLDCGLRLFVFFGEESAHWERRKGNTIANELREQRLGKPTIEIVDGSDDDNEAFWAEFGGKSEVPPASAGGDDNEVTQMEKRLYQLSDETGELVCTQLPSVTRDSLNSVDVFLLDMGVQIFVFVGEGSSKAEKANAMQYATGFVTQTGRPAYTPITRIVEGGDEPAAFTKAFD
ncbi:MAG: hypothetical protein MHM6MM_001103 [Cercozoa sp. M6MM]